MFDVCRGRKCEGVQPTPGTPVRQVQPAAGLRGVTVEQDVRLVLIRATLEVTRLFV